MDSPKILGQVKLAESTMTEVKPPASVAVASVSSPKVNLNPIRPRQSPRGLSVANCVLTVLFGPKTLTKLAFILSIYLILMTLSYNEVIDPCTFKFTYYRHCQKDVYFHNHILSFTNYKEDYFCAMPGVYYHEEQIGWNLGIEC